MGTKLLQFFLITKFKITNSFSSLQILGLADAIDKVGDTVKDVADKVPGNSELISCGDFEGLISDAFRFFKILAPILLILFGTLDFVGAVVSGNGDMKKAGERFAKRLAAAALVFLIPTLLNIVLGFAVDRGIISSYLRCWL